jgi:hypothetical protein
MSYWELAIGGRDIVLIQEPWVYGDQIRGLCNERRRLCSTGPSVAPRACIFVRSTLQAFSLLVLSSPTRTNGNPVRKTSRLTESCTKGCTLDVVCEVDYSLGAADHSLLLSPKIPTKVAFSPRRVPWWSKELSHLKASTRQLFNKVKKLVTGNPLKWSSPIIAIEQEKSNCLLGQITVGGLSMYPTEPA